MLQGNEASDYAHDINLLQYVEYRPTKAPIGLVGSKHKAAGKEVPSGVYADEIEISVQLYRFSCQNFFNVKGVTICFELLIEWHLKIAMLRRVKNRS